MLAISGRRMQPAFAGTKAGSFGLFAPSRTCSILDRLPKPPDVSSMIDVQRLRTTIVRENFLRIGCSYFPQQALAIDLSIAGSW